MLAAVVLVLVLALGAWSAVEMVSALTRHADESAALANVVARFDALAARAADADSAYRAHTQTTDAGYSKAFDDAVAGIRSEFQEALKLTATHPRVQADLLAAQAVIAKKLESVRAAMDVQRTADGAYTPLAEHDTVGETVKKAIAPLRKAYDTALQDRRSKPDDVVSYAGYWLLATWLLAAAVGVAIAGLAIGQARVVGRLQWRLRRESISDNLTGLPNNVYLEDWLSRSLSRASGAGVKVGVLYVDINNFSQVNQALGRDEGDRVLVEVADKLRSISRQSDFVARVRNDSFAIVIQDVTDVAELEDSMSRLRALSVARGGIPIKITVGAAVFPEDAENPENLLRLSRAAMYRNRHTRRAA